VDAARRDRARLKSEFVATASHELRSPLTSIKGFVELLSSGDGLDARQREFVDIVLVSTNRLVDLVNDLLDVARLEAGRVEVHRRAVDIGDAARDVATLLRARIEEKGQSLELDIAPDTPRVLADPTRMRQMLMNLVTNAHLYTDEDGWIEIRAAPAATGVRIEVNDNGRGMNAAELEHVFERFARGLGSQGTPGTGLGLAIVKSLVDLHGGTIDVASTPGEGTSFAITLPAAPAPGVVQQPRDVLRGRRVMVIDDEPETARLIAARLEPFEVACEIVTDGPTALRRLREEHFDALTLDVLMPGMSGFEVLRELRADPALAELPVVVVSVFSGREALSGEWVVSKPIDAEELADALGAAVMAGRVRVIAVGRPAIRRNVSQALDGLAIEHEWASTPLEAARLCATRRFEVALVDAGLPDVEAAIAGLELRGRRLRRSSWCPPTATAPPRASRAWTPTRFRSMRPVQRFWPSWSLPPTRTCRLVAARAWPARGPRPRSTICAGGSRTSSGRRPRRSSSSSATRPTCARRSSASASAGTSCAAPTWRRCGRSATPSRRATPTPASMPSASPPTAWRSRACSTPRSPTTPTSSSASCCTMSARSPFPTRSSGNRLR
jgi:CheY-like chemotaxis protein/anti-sigma regulatory factor (Ser/Thr protein kinase)